MANLAFYEAPENAFMQTFINAIPLSNPLPARHSAFVPAMEELANSIQQIGLFGEDPALVVEELDLAVKELYGQ